MQAFRCFLPKDGPGCLKGWPVQIFCSRKALQYGKLRGVFFAGTEIRIFFAGAHRKTDAAGKAYA